MTVLNFPATPALNDTYTENGVTYTWNGDYWQANSGSALDDFYVKIAGDSMTGNLLLPGGGGNTAALQKQEIDALIAADDATNNLWKKDAGALKPKVSTDNVDIGNGKITLNANGSMNAAGTRYTLSTNGSIDCQVSGPDIAKYTRDGDIGNVGIEYGDASYGVRAGLGNTGVFGIAANGVNLVTSSAIELNADGSGQFTGDILIGGTLPSSPNITLTADGKFIGSVLELPNSNFASRINTYGDNDEKVFLVDRGGTTQIGGDLSGVTAALNTPNITLKEDGSAVFVGSVKIGGTAAANEMDVYEEGTWTPIHSDATSTAKLSGSYVRLGDEILIKFSAGGTGTLKPGSISGLPFSNMSTATAPGAKVAQLTGETSDESFVGWNPFFGSINLNIAGDISVATNTNSYTFMFNTFLY